MATAEENYKRLSNELDKRLKADKRLAAIADKISKGKADFTDTEKYSHIVSQYMGEVISEYIGEITMPLGKEYVCKALLREHYDRINDVLGEVQASVDDKLGIHLNPIKAPFPTERVDKAAHSLEDPTVPKETIERRAKSVTENCAESMHDDYIKENAGWREQAGLDCYLVRDAGGGCCPWCQALVGKYPYATAPDDIFRRHDNCKCNVTYICGKKRQDVWSKKTWEEPEDKLAARKELEEQSLPKANTKEQAKELEKKLLDKPQESGIIKAITIDDFELAASGSNVSQDVLDVLLDEIHQVEKSAGFIYSDVLFDSLGGSDLGTYALQTEMMPNGLFRLNVNTDVFAGYSVEQINKRFSDTESILANSIHEALIHERGHAKYMKGRSAAEVSELHKNLLNKHIAGVSTIAYNDGAECIAEVEVLLDKKMPVPDEAMSLYNEYVRK